MNPFVQGIMKVFLSIEWKDIWLPNCRIITVGVRQTVSSCSRPSGVVKCWQYFSGCHPQTRQQYGSQLAAVNFPQQLNCGSQYLSESFICCDCSQSQLSKEFIWTRKRLQRIGYIIASLCIENDLKLIVSTFSHIILCCSKSIKDVFHLPIDSIRTTLNRGLWTRNEAIVQ